MPTESLDLYLCGGCGGGAPPPPHSHSKLVLAVDWQMCKKFISTSFIKVGCTKFHQALDKRVTRRYAHWIAWFISSAGGVGGGAPHSHSKLVLAVDWQMCKNYRSSSFINVCCMEFHQTLGKRVTRRYARWIARQIIKNYTSTSFINIGCTKFHQTLGKRVTRRYHRVQRLMLSKGAKRWIFLRYHMISEIFLTNDYRTEWRHQ